MELKWDDLPAKTQQCLEKSLLFSIAKMNHFELNSFLTGADDLVYDWTQSAPLRKLFFQRFTEIFSTPIKESERQFQTIFDHIAKRKFRWEELPFEMQESILHGIEYYSSSADSQWVSSIIDE
jgi:hypothetical protein